MSTNKVEEALDRLCAFAVNTEAGVAAYDAAKCAATIRTHIEGLEARLATQTDNALVLEARVRELEAKVEELDGLILQNGELDGHWW